MIALGIISAIIFLISVVLSVWYLARWIISKKDMKPRFKKRFFLSMGTFIVSIIGTGIFGGMENDRKAAELGFETSAEYLAAQKENIDDPTIWTEIVARRQIEAQAAAEKEQAEAEQARVVAEEEAAKVRAAEAEQQAQEEEDQAAAEKEQAESEEARIAEEEEDCRREISCWGEKATTAAMFSCPRHIERMARYDHEWTDGFLGVKFSHYRWRDIENGIVTVIGDKIKFQNGFGAWSNMIYECDINPKTNVILDVRVSGGRL